MKHNKKNNKKMSLLSLIHPKLGASTPGKESFAQLHGCPYDRIEIISTSSVLSSGFPNWEINLFIKSAITNTLLRTHLLPYFSMLWYIYFLYKDLYVQRHYKLLYLTAE